MNLPSGRKKGWGAGCLKCHFVNLDVLVAWYAALKLDCINEQPCFSQKKTNAKECKIHLSKSLHVSSLFHEVHYKMSTTLKSNVWRVSLMVQELSSVLEILLLK